MIFKKLLGIALMMFISFGAWSMQLNINTASAPEIATHLMGVGSVKAEEIVRYREQHGEFKMLQDLEKVRGIGSKTVERNADKIIFTDPN